MNLDKELINYEIGGIGDIKKYTLRFHSYYLKARDGEVTIYAEYEPGNPPKVFNGYPSGQELLLELCNLYLEVKDNYTKFIVSVSFDLQSYTENKLPLLIYTIGDFYQAVPLVSLQNESLNTGDVEHFVNRIMISKNKSYKGEKLKIYLRNRKAYEIF